MAASGQYLVAADRGWHPDHRQGTLNRHKRFANVAVSGVYNSATGRGLRAGFIIPAKWSSPTY
jgi:hypothetical protein